MNWSFLCFFYLSAGRFNFDLASGKMSQPVCSNVILWLFFSLEDTKLNPWQSIKTIYFQVPTRVRWLWQIWSKLLYFFFLFRLKYTHLKFLLEYIQITKENKAKNWIPKGISKRSLDSYLLFFFIQIYVINIVPNTVWYHSYPNSGIIFKGSMQRI